MTSRRLPWTVQEDTTLKLELPWKELMLKLPKRSLASIKRRSRVLGLNCIRDSKYWTDIETESLRKCAPDYTKATDLLPRFSYSAILQKAKKLRLPVCRVIEKWSEEEDRILMVYGTQMGNVELVKFLPRRSAVAIGRRCLGLGIKKSAATISRLGRLGVALLDRDKSCKIDQQLTIDDLNNNEVQIIFGSILGDAAITKASGLTCLRNYCFSEGHCEEQLPYLQWKATLLDRFHPSLSKLRPNSGYINGKLINAQLQSKLTTASHPIFTKMRNEMYALNNKNKWRKRYIPDWMAERLDLFGLLIWYLDDGSSGINRDKLGPSNPVISCSLLDKDHLQTTLDSLNSRFDLKLSISGDTITFGMWSRNKLLPIWKELAEKYNLPSCMHYKLQHEYAVTKDGYYSCAPWSSSEVDILEAAFRNGASDKKLSALLPKRTVRAIKLRRRSIELLHQKRWSDDEINILITNPMMRIKVLHQTMLPQRSERSIAHKRSRLGIRKRGSY